jgi:hypothetical protein
VLVNTSELKLLCLSLEKLPSFDSLCVRCEIEVFPSVQLPGMSTPHTALLGPCMTLAEYEAAVANDERVLKERRYAEMVQQRREPIARARAVALRELRAVDRLQAAAWGDEGLERRWCIPAAASRQSPSPAAANPQPPPFPSLGVDRQTAQAAPPPRSVSVTTDSSDATGGPDAEPAGAAGPQNDPSAPRPWRPLSSGGRGLRWVPERRPCIPLADEAVIETSSVEWKDWRQSRLPVSWPPAVGGERPPSASALPLRPPSGNRRPGSSGAAPEHLRRIGGRLSFSASRTRPDAVGPRVRAAVIHPPPAPHVAKKSANLKYHRWSVVRKEADIRENETCNFVGKILATDTDLMRVHACGAGQTLPQSDRFGSIGAPKGGTMPGSARSPNRQMAFLEHRMSLRLKAAERLWAPKKEIMTFGGS